VDERSAKSGDMVSGRRW